MGFRFRKSTNIGPFRLNLSKSGVSYSAGVKGFRVTKRADGRVQTTTSIPGTGISHVSTHGKSNQQKAVSKNTDAKKPGIFSKILTFILVAAFTAFIILMLIAALPESFALVLTIALYILPMVTATITVIRMGKKSD